MVDAKAPLRSEIVSVRVTPRERVLLERAAQRSRTQLSAFIRGCALSEAEACERALPEVKRVRLVDVVEVASSVGKKDEPNRLGLRSLSASLAACIQTLGAAREAYTLIKRVFALIGLCLP